VKNIDWPFAIGLAVVFVVMSIARWRYFKSLARRRELRSQRPPDNGAPPA
jgi:hypothetical protein